MASCSQIESLFQSPMPIVNSKRESQRGSINGSGFRRLLLNPRRFLPHVLAIAAACVFIVLASYRIELPGLYMDEVDFINSAIGAPDNTMILMRIGSIQHIYIL